jgi:hypothetical protein
MYDYLTTELNRELDYLGQNYDMSVKRLVWNKNILSSATVWQEWITPPTVSR